MKYFPPVDPDLMIVPPKSLGVPTTPAHFYTQSVEVTGHPILGQHTGVNWPLVFLFGWVVIQSTPFVQTIFPLYGTLRLREITAVALVLLAILQGRSRGDKKVWGLAYAVFLYVFITVARSDAYDLTTQLRLFTRLIIMFSFVPVIVAFIRTETDARQVFMFILLWCGLLALSGPLQEITGPIGWVNEDVDWALLHGRSGFARYLSVFGDPNVGAMCGGLLPLVTLTLSDGNRKPGLAWFVLTGIINVWAIALVAYSVSQAGLFLLASSLLSSWWIDREHRWWQVLQIGVIVIMSLLVIPDMGDRILGILENAGAEAPNWYLSGPGWLSQSTKLLRDLDFRLFAYLDMNDTISKILLGSGYNVVVPSSYYNPLGVLAHNGYKEIYLNGGLLGLALYGLLFVLTSIRAIRIVRSASSLLASQRWMWAVVVACFQLLIVMFTFPIYHYTGIGIIFWGCVGLIHAIYARFEMTSDASRVADARKNRVPIL